MDEAAGDTLSDACSGSHDATISGAAWAQGIVLNDTGVDASDAFGDEPGAAGSILSRSAPNPFRSQTTVSFDLPERTFVSLPVYDVSGRLVAPLVEATLDSGRHAVVRDARGLASVHPALAGV